MLLQLYLYTSGGSLDLLLEWGQLTVSFHQQVFLNAPHYPFHPQQFTAPAVIDQLAYVLIACGAVTFFLSFLGYCGAIRESTCLLYTVSGRHQHNLGTALILLSVGGGDMYTAEHLEKPQ